MECQGGDRFSEFALKKKFYVTFTAISLEF